MYVWLLISPIIVCNAVIALSNCTNKYMSRPLNGYHCETGNYANFTESQHHCTTICIRDPRCWVISFNAAKGHCLLNSEPCALAEKHPEFMLLVFRSDEVVQCSSWVPPPNTGSALPPRPITNREQRISRAVGRIKRGLSVHPGHINHYRSSGPGFFPVNGEMVRAGTQFELLSASVKCTFAWHPYIAGDPLPRGALPAGYLEAIGQTYSMRVKETNDGVDAFGYYAPGDSNGYIVQGTRITPEKEMDILIQV